MIIAHERSGEYGELLGSIKAAMFLGTPHRGSDAAYWATYAANVLKVLQLGRRNNTAFVSTPEKLNRVREHIAAMDRACSSTQDPDLL
jgi:hypothetical protein